MSLRTAWRRSTPLAPDAVGGHWGPVLDETSTKVGTLIEVTDTSSVAVIAAVCACGQQCEPGALNEQDALNALAQHRKDKHL